MGRSSFESKNLFKDSLSEYRISKSVSNVGELLILSPFDIELRPFLIWVVIFRSILFSLFKVDLLCLREPGSCWFSPPVVEVKEHVVEAYVSIVNRFHLIQPSWDVTQLI